MGRRREGEPSRTRPIRADDGRRPLGRRQWDLQTKDSERPIQVQLILTQSCNIRGSPYNQAALAYRHAQMLLYAGNNHVLDMWV